MLYLRGTVADRLCRCRSTSLLSDPGRKAAALYPLPGPLRHSSRMDEQVQVAEAEISDGITSGHVFMRLTCPITTRARGHGSPGTFRHELYAWAYHTDPIYVILRRIHN